MDGGPEEATLLALAEDVPERPGVVRRQAARRNVVFETQPRRSDSCGSSC